MPIHIQALRFQSGHEEPYSNKTKVTPQLTHHATAKMALPAKSRHHCIAPRAHASLPACPCNYGCAAPKQLTTPPATLQAPARQERYVDNAQAGPNSRADPTLQKTGLGCQLGGHRSVVPCATLPQKAWTPPGPFQPADVLGDVLWNGATQLFHLRQEHRRSHDGVNTASSLLQHHLVTSAC